MPTVLLSSSFGGQRVQLFWSCERTERGRSRLSASMPMIAASDTGAPWMPRMLVTVTCLPSDGWSITPSTPVPSACTHLSLGALAKTSSRSIGPKLSRMSALDASGVAFEK